MSRLGTTSAPWDAVIVGGGHNGLVCAALLAKAGKKVLVLERRERVGGATLTEEHYPGFRYTVASYVVSLLRPWLWRELDLARHGLQLIPLETSFSPYPDGRSLCRGPDPIATREEIAAFSRRDAEIYPTFGKSMGRLARFVKRFVDQTAPDPTSFRPRDLAQLVGHGRAFRELPDDEEALLTRLLTASATDFLRETFEADELIAPMSCSGIIGTCLGVSSPGTAYVLLHHYMGEIDGASRAWGLARGGNGAVAEAIASSARASGVTIRTSAAVDKILVERDRAVGVVLVDGEEIRARTVVSGCEPRLTMLKMVGRDHLPSDYTAGLERYKNRGSSGKVNLSLDFLPEFTCRPGDGHLRGDIAIAPSTAYLEQAFAEAKAGRWSRRPYLNVVIPSLLDRTMAPPGKHVMSIFVQYAPYHLADGPSSWPQHRDAFRDDVLDTLQEYCPRLRDAILHAQVLSPWDLEQDFGLTEGNIFHGELTLDQILFQRPVAGWARYKTPVRDLWMCASGTHPGGGVMGAPGGLCAREMLAAGAL